MNFQEGIFVSAQSSVLKSGSQLLALNRNASQTNNMPADIQYVEFPVKVRCEYNLYMAW